MRIKLLTMLSIAFLLTACTSDNLGDLGNESTTGSENSTAPKLKLNVSTLGAGTADNSEGSLSEKIKSLRVVMLSDGFVEYNAKIDFTAENGAKDANNFNQILERATVAGNKSFYLFANEESVKSVNFDGITELPEWITQDLSLGDFLNHYTRDKLPAQGTLGYTNSGSGSEFEQLVNSLYFSPDYTITDNTVYLPYTSYYTGYPATNDPDVTREVSMFLVPVATKFTFNFRNYRKEKTQVHDIFIAKLNTSNYLMANLDDTELRKTYKGKESYWIDWLAEVSYDSQRDGGSADFNNKAGWIEKYFMPVTTGDDLLERCIARGENDNWIIERLIDKDKPDVLTIVRYYPESKNMSTKTVFNKEKNDYEEIDAQVYEVKFKVQEIRTGVIPTEPITSAYLLLDKVNALFRNSHVVVNIDMYDSIVEAYCEIAPWNISTPAKGFVEQKDDD